MWNTGVEFKCRVAISLVSNSPGGGCDRNSSYYGECKDTVVKNGHKSLDTTTYTGASVSCSD